MDAYYYGFDATGVPEIDRILCSVASAGKAYHHTEHWGDPSLEGGTNYVSLIQRAADEAAKAMRATLDPSKETPAASGGRDGVE